jgi:WD40 repeat protein
MVGNGLLSGTLTLLVLTTTASPDPPAAKPVKPLLTLRGHTKLVSSVQYSPDGKRLATASPDTLAVLWEAATGEQLHAFRHRGVALWSAAFDPRSDRLATGGEGGGNPVSL